MKKQLLLLSAVVSGGMTLVLMGLVAGIANAAIFREVSGSGSSIESCNRAKQNARSNAEQGCSDDEAIVNIEVDPGPCSTLKVVCGDGLDSEYRSYDCTKYTAAVKWHCVRER